MTRKTKENMPKEKENVHKKFFNAAHIDEK